MADILFENDEHRCIFFEDFTEGEMVSANQHLIIHKGKGMLLDPGGHKVYSKIMAAMPEHLAPSALKYLFLSHQDPDIVASVNGWLMITDADAYLSAIWKRFVAHFGVDGSVMDRMKEIPDQGAKLDLEGCELMIIPAHFLHSAGNFHVYDPISKILYTGDLGAALVDYRFVEDFEAHTGHMAGFHQRYMGSNTACQLWAKMVRELDIEIIAPQHGAMFKGKEMVTQFIDWVEGLDVGADAMKEIYKLPA
ncbi:metallo-beta-lactamase superfamily protein [Mariprofundus micogutta]|uniref:Metallo-beta-lactamase superfamily protein n=1 Tax=Mariprofundus micogutta TaxID=1921010 RepID=A0A1L8CLQ7_9PROT|nr:MBL fold metallo-hydrolase [Mariprofundus micogutta]GAV19860.1 metallo-beta-lactamase superfamily protein [Mariprofundus micogutta]